jgi:hypothetical protein
MQFVLASASPSVHERTCPVHPILFGVLVVTVLALAVVFIGGIVWSRLPDPEIAHAKALHGLATSHHDRVTSGS